MTSLQYRNTKFVYFKECSTTFTLPIASVSAIYLYIHVYTSDSVNKLIIMHILSKNKHVNANSNRIEFANSIQSVLLYGYIINDQKS